MIGRTIIAIDPGSEGAVAWQIGQVVSVIDLPTVTTELSKRRADGSRKQRKTVDPEALARLLLRISEWAPTTIIVEALPAVMSAMSGFSALLQGANYGRVEGVVGAFCTDPHRRRQWLAIDARTWRKHHALESGEYADRKAASIARAVDLFPELADSIIVPPTGRQRVARRMDGRADALLMLAYLRAQVEREG